MQTFALVGNSIFSKNKDCSDIQTEPPLDSIGDNSQTTPFPFLLLRLYHNAEPTIGTLAQNS
ncbi:hypothetical protein SLEP1_g37261 [Rubroshorea leprosula]|uniref:Uncharacterized protein n=1 Tax=Rubroshorea leprosula TaxID=152421 RepID=A0AAV5KUQ7_9ROSI|nr:hypothetical protein SLEP1_g37261 [Rubroshorea leprosula]